MQGLEVAMKTRPKTLAEIKIMREAGRMLGEVLAGLADLIEPGITTKELDVWAEKKIRSFGATPTFKGYQGYPATLCVSINEEVVHGIPSKKRKIKKGDIVGIDCGVTYMGYISDSAVTVMVGEVPPKVKRLVEVTKEALMDTIAHLKANMRVGDIGFHVQSIVESNGFFFFFYLTGHGVGKELHEFPQIPNYGQPGTGPIITPGTTIAIEPMVNMGNWRVKVLKDGWTVVTADGKPSAHWEHTMVVWEDHTEILSVRPQWSKV